MAVRKSVTERNGAAGAFPQTVAPGDAWDMLGVSA